jgi:hypothetical protein
MQTPHHARGLNFILIEAEGAQLKQKLKELKMLMKPNLEIKSPQVHMLEKDALYLSCC